MIVTRGVEVVWRMVRRADFRGDGSARRFPGAVCVSVYEIEGMVLTFNLNVVVLVMGFRKREVVLPRQNSMHGFM